MAIAADFYGLHPGMDERELKNILIDQGDGFYKGIIGNCFISLMSFNGKVGVIDIVYDYSGDNSPPPIQFRKHVDLKSAIQRHSLNAECMSPEFGVAKKIDGRVYGVVDYVNNISYTINGPLLPVSQCVQVTYLSPQAPLIANSRNDKISSTLASELTGSTSEIKIFDDDYLSRQANKQQTESSDGNISSSKLTTEMPKKMADCFSVELVSQKLEKFGVTDRLVFTLVFNNRTPKAIRGIKGDVQFSDMFGDAIYTLTLKIDEPLAAGARRIEDYGIEFNKYMHSHRALLTTKAQDIKLHWKPEMILFCDGSSVKKVVVQKQLHK